MADQQATLANNIGKETHDDGRVHHILKLLDDCLIEIFGYLSPSELCCVSETCKRFQEIARIAFRRQWKDKKYTIPSFNIKMAEHPRILRCFGDLFEDVAILNMTGELSSVHIKRAFDWLERYCKDTVQAVTVLDMNKRALPPSAVRLMTRVKKFSLWSDILPKDARALLSGCKELVELNMLGYQGPFYLYDLNFPNLRKLSDRIQMTNIVNFGLLETFYENHSMLTSLKMDFLVGSRFPDDIDLTFLSYLENLETLELRLSGIRVTDTDALANLKKLKSLTFDHSKEVATDIKILENIPVENLVELTMGLSEINGLVASIARFKNLTHLTVSQNLLPIFCEFDTNISGLSQLLDSQLTELKISCRKLLEPETIVAVIRNLTELKVVIFDCAIDLTETICKQLVAVCSGQKRCIEIRLREALLDETDTDFGYIDRSNEQNGMFVRVAMI